MSWNTAATNIIDALNLAKQGQTVWLSNGTYNTSIIIGNGITVRSANCNPANVVLNGGGTGICVEMNSDSWLIGVTCSNGYWNGSVYKSSGINSGNASNCVSRNNNCSGDYAYGGGAKDSTLYSCIIKNNSSRYGGGVYNCKAYNCLIYGNSASAGGGIMGGTYWNCTVVANSSSSYGSGVRDCTLYNCISWDNAGNAQLDYNYTAYYSCGVGWGGTGCITNNPLFVSTTNFNLQAGSPCKDTGTNFWWMSQPYDARSRDIDSYQRIFNTTVDMGCYEYGSSPWAP
jgi:hypothetical protein